MGLRERLWKRVRSREGEGEEKEECEEGARLAYGEEEIPLNLKRK